MMSLAVTIGGGSLLLFGAFLIIAPPTLLDFDVSESEALFWDVLLSILFFVQHSGMMRSSFRTKLASIIPCHYHPSIYAIASGMALLTAVSLFCQLHPTVLYRFEGRFHFLARLCSLFAIAGFWWGVRSLQHFDTFGLSPIKAHIRGKQLRAPIFTLRGPYLWVRHPLFFLALLIWTSPDGTLDRLLFNVLWTSWIVLGTYFEEKDLVAEFGVTYRRYQKNVPMLFPWQFADRKTIKSH